MAVFSSLPSASAWRENEEEHAMLKGGLLWLIGIPIPIILGLWAFGVLG